MFGTHEGHNNHHRAYIAPDSSFRSFRCERAISGGFLKLIFRNSLDKHDEVPENIILFFF